MSYRPFLVALCGLALCSCGSKKTETAATEPAKPLKRLNVLVVTIDTLRADHLHAYGYAEVETPNLDRLASQGVLFEHAVAQTPLTPPSHASIFTGTYPTVHKVRNTGGFVLHSSAITLAKILQQQGWDTAAFVGAAVLKKGVGFANGFAVYDDTMPKVSKREELGEYPERRAGEVVDRALAWLNGQSGKPFFVWVHVYDPHIPYDPPQPFKAKYKGRPYDGEIAYTDRELGRLFDAVENKAPRNTIVAVLADHGESLGEHGEFQHGVFLYDSTLHIPFLMKGPGVPAGVRVAQQARTIDVLPTLMALMGGSPPKICQGASMVPAFSGKAVAAAGVSFEETLYPKMNMGWAELRGIRTDRWKYIRAPKPELYDLAADPRETKNVLDAHPKEYRELDQQLRADIETKDGKPEKVEAANLDQHSMEQLKSLGYVAGFTGRQYELNGAGADPKDKVAILKAIDLVDGNGPKPPLPRSIDILKQALAEDASNPALYYILGNDLEKAGRYEEAMKLYLAATQNGIQNGKLWSRIGDLYLKSGRRTEAIAYYEKAAQYNPSDSESQTNLATAYLEQGRVDDAERVFKWVLTLEDTAAANNGLGLVWIQRQNPAEARQYFEKAIQLDPDLVEAQLNLGLIYRMGGDNSRARTCFKAFLAKASPKQYAEVISKVKQELAAMP